MATESQILTISGLRLVPITISDHRMTIEFQTFHSSILPNSSLFHLYFYLLSFYLYIRI